MSTSTVLVNDTSYTQVAADNEDFIIQSPLSHATTIVFSATLPANDAQGIRLAGGQMLTRNGVGGNVYAKGDSGTYDVVTASTVSA